MKYKMNQTRRDFLVRTGCAALSAAAFQAGFKQFGLINAYAQAQTNAPSDYKALVCIFLNGGNDSNNMVVPTGAGYTPYAAVRQSAGLAIPQASLLGPLAPASLPGQTFGLHPNMPELLALWTQQKMAIVPNVGPLVQPISRTQYRSGIGRPYQLFSHSDQVQQWQTSRSDIRTQVGWGGRTADKVAFLNGAISFPVITSVTGSTVFGQGLSTRPLTISSGTPLNQVLVLNGFTASSDDTNRLDSMAFLRTIDRSASMVAAASDGTQQGVDIISSLTTDPTLATVFPNSGLGQQMKQIAKVIKLNLTNPSLGLNRQIFFASLGGFDTHQNQIPGHVQLYTQVSQSMKAFYDATVEMGVSDRVTQFTLSDFGRTLAPSGSGAQTSGSDHGWGSHQIVVGGSVHGGNFFGVGRPTSNGTIFPTLALGGNDDTDNRGRWLPTVAVEQYAATMATWFGLPAADLPTVFPLLSRFTTPNLGFV
jgi:uncharacterized protein (DUF1501 family)